jgi:hypothetical protein
VRRNISPFRAASRRTTPELALGGMARLGHVPVRDEPMQPCSTNQRELSIYRPQYENEVCRLELYIAPGAFPSLL